MGLEALFTNGTEVEFKGAKITIREVCMDDLPIVTRIVGKVILEKGDTASKITKLVTEDFDSVKKLISSLTNIEESKVGKLPLDAVVFILSKIIELNVVFLKKNIVPTAQKLVKELNQTGSTLSNS